MSTVYKSSPNRSPKKTFATTQIPDPYNNLRFSISNNKRHSLNGSVKKGQDPTSQVGQEDDYKLKCRDLEIQVQKLEQAFQDVPRTSNLEIEKLQKQYAQKRNEAELWKQKYENTCGQMMQVKANYELEVQQLSIEVQRLLQRIDDADNERYKHVEQTKQIVERNTQAHLDGVHKQQREILEVQNRALREQIDNREIQVEDLQAKLERIREDHFFELQRQQKENENLRQRIGNLEYERQREVESVRNRMDNFNNQTLENLKQTHNNSKEVLENEIDKLRSLLDVKNVEIETLISQNSRQKQNYETKILELRESVDGLKEKLMEKEQVHHQLLDQLQSQLQQEQYESILQIKDNYERSIETLQNELQNVRGHLDRNIQELEDLNQNAQITQDALKLQIDEIKKQFEEAEKEWFIEKDNLDEENRKLQMQTSELTVQYKNQPIYYETEINKLKDIIIQKNRENEQLISQQKSNGEQINALLQENEILRNRIQDIDRLKSAEFEDFKNRVISQEQNQREKSRQIDLKIESLTVEQRHLTEQLDAALYELERAKQGKLIQDKENNRIKDENQDLKNRILTTEREKVKELEELKQKLQNSTNFQIENLKAAFNTQMSILGGENSDLKQMIQSKQRELDEIIYKYQELEKAISTGQYGPELNASRSICDVYIRSKTRSDNKKIIQ